MTKTNVANDTVKKRVAKEKKDFLEAYKKQWTMTGAARAIGRNRITGERWLREDKEFKRELNEIKREHIDFAVSKLIELLNDGNLGAIIYFLKCQSKQWSPLEKRQISGKLHTEVEQKIRADPTLKKAVKFYEEELKKEYRGRDSGHKHTSLDKRGKHKKRKRRSD